MYQYPSANNDCMNHRIEYRNIIAYLNQRPGTKFNGYYLAVDDIKRDVEKFVQQLQTFSKTMHATELLRLQVVVDLSGHHVGLGCCITKNNPKVFLVESAGDPRTQHMCYVLYQLFAKDNFYFYSSSQSVLQMQYDQENCFWIILKCMLELSKLNNYFDKFKQTSGFFDELPPQLAVILKPIQRVNIAEWESIKTYGDRMRSVGSAGAAITSNAACAAAAAAPLATQSFHGQTVIQTFEAVAQQVPGNIAISYEDQSLTYRQLNAKANQLAHFI